MKRNVLICALTISTVALTGCVTPDGRPDQTATGALAGSAIGAASGAIIGSAGGHAGEGALIGGAIGAITGTLIGHSIKEEERARLRQQAPQTYERVEQGQPLSVTDVKALAKAGVSDDVIINQIRSSRTVYRLSASDIIDLHNSSVSETVISFMINTPNTAGAPAVVAAPPAVVDAPPPPPPPVETVVVAPGPEYVWVGGEWMWNDRWVWVGGHWGLRPRPQAVWVQGYWVQRGWHSWGRVPGHWR